MIILKILLWIILALLGIVLLILILPISADFSFIGGKIQYGAKYAYIPVFNSKGTGIVNKLMKRKKKNKKPDSEDDEPTEENAVSEESVISEETVSESTENPTETPEDISAEHEETESEPVEVTETENAEDSEDNSTPEKPIQPEPLEKPTNEVKEEKSKLEFILGLWEAADRPLLRIFKGIKISELYIDFFIANEDAYKCALNYGRISGAIYNLIAWLSVLFNVKLKTIDVNPLFAQKKSKWDVSLNISFSLIILVIAGIQFLIIYLFRVLIPSKIQSRKAR
mgnify:CR=1 FL=1